MRALALQWVVSHDVVRDVRRTRAWSCRWATLSGAFKGRRPSLVASTVLRKRGRRGAVNGTAAVAPCGVRRWASHRSSATRCVCPVSCCA